MRNFRTNAFYRASRRFFAAKPESEAERESKRDHQPLKECRHKSACDIELVQCRKNTENPNRILGNCAGEIRRACTRGASGTRNQVLRHLRNNCGNYQDYDRDDDLREIEQNHRLKIVGDLSKTQNLKRCHKKHDYYEPLDQSAEETTDIQVEASLFRRFIDTSCFERVIYAQNSHYLFNNAVQNNTDDPANNKNNNGHYDRRQVRRHDSP